MAQFSAVTPCFTAMSGAAMGAAAATDGASHQPCFQAWHCQIPGLYGKDTFSCGSSVHTVMSSPSFPRSQGCVPYVMENYPKCSASHSGLQIPISPVHSAFLEIQPTLLHLYSTPLTFVSNSQDTKTKSLVPEALGALSTVDLNSRCLHPVLKATNFLLKEILQLLPSFPGFLNLINRSMLLKGISLHLITAPPSLGWR